jgi:hypothetical protein
MRQLKDEYGWMSYSTHTSNGLMTNTKEMRKRAAVEHF